MNSRCRVFYVLQAKMKQGIDFLHNYMCMKKIICCIIASSLLWSCNSTKYIPDGQYLMSGYKIKSDTKKIDATFFEEYVRQQPNSSIRLGIYDLSGQDTSKWINRTLRKIGQAPVIYSATQTKMSATQIAKELSNQGYLRAEVDTTLKAKGKDMYITYNIHNNGIYTVRNYEYTIGNKEINRRLSNIKKFTQIKSGISFDQGSLESSRERLTSYLRNVGYYNFSKEYLYYKADTTLNSHQVDLFLSLYNPLDSISFKRYKIRNVTVLTGFDAMSRGNEKLFANPDTIDYKGLKIIYGKNNFLRKSAIYRNTYIRPDKFYSDMAYTRTTSAFNGTGVVKQTNISYTPVSNTNTTDSIEYLDANISLAPGNIHYFQTELQGTNSAGDLGIAPSITYQHLNLFNGAEILKIKLRGAYEFVSNNKEKGLANKNYYEFGIDGSLSFPQFLFPWLKQSWREQPSSSTQISVGLNNQHRKDYTRQFFNAGLTYRWTSSRSRLSHAFSLWDINYVRMPWASDSFRQNYLSDNSNVNEMIRESYKDQLIASTKYGLTYTNSSRRYGKASQNQTSIRFNVDYSGWLPRLATLQEKKDSTGFKKILGIAYAEYIKGDVSFSRAIKLNRTNSLAYRVGLGVAQPYGNSKVLPFETRYFSGGSNSVRGWRTRELGPGSIPDTTYSYVKRVGDIKLDLGIEYRHKLSDLIEVAGFADAGNIWTIKNYLEQPDGMFKFSKFYKEIALAYGIGFRLDLGFLLLRLDFGVRAYDPGRPEGNRWVIFKPTFDRMAWHFGIGYPF